MKKLLIGLAATFVVGSVNAATITFTNASGVYASSPVGVTATVTTTPSGSAGALNYVSGSGIGVGSTSNSGAVMGYVGSIFGGSYNTTETMTVTFNQAVILDQVWFHS